MLSNKNIILILIIFSASIGTKAYAESYAPPKTLSEMRKETARILNTSPKPSDKVLIEKYKLEKREGNIWDAPYPEDGDDPSPAPEGFFLINDKGLHAYIGWQALPKAKCSLFKNKNARAYLCTAPKADKKAVAEFKAKINNLLLIAD